MISPSRERKRACSFDRLRTGSGLIEGARVRANAVRTTNFNPLPPKEGEEIMEKRIRRSVLKDKTFASG